MAVGTTLPQGCRRRLSPGTGPDRWTMTQQPPYGEPGNPWQTPPTGLSGLPVSTPATSFPPYYPAEPRRRRGVLITSIVLVLLLALGGGGVAVAYVLTRNRDGTGQI